MKTLSDPNTTLLQEARSAQFVLRAELLRQWPGAIISRDSATQITVAGDARNLFQVNDVLTIPLEDFELNRTVTALTYNSGPNTTEIDISGTNFPTGIEGLFVTKNYLVSYGDIERMLEVGSVRYEIEGDSLNDFHAADVPLVFENGDNFFSKKDGSGIFDTGDVIWVRIYVGFKGATDRVLLFGGIVDREDIFANPSAKQFEATAYGHIKELERYPALAISDLNGRMMNLRGIEIMGITADDMNAISEDVYDLEYSFPKKDPFSDLTIKNIPIEIAPGMHIIKFIPPDKWEFDYGGFTAQTAGATDVVLTDGLGNDLTVDMPKAFLLEPAYLLFFIDRNVNKNVVGPRGTATLRFGGGEEVDLIFDFQHIFWYNGTTWADRTHELQWTRYNWQFAILGASNSQLLILSPKKFEGIELILASNLAATVVFEYSQGFNAWGNLTVIDGTNGLTQSGRVTWSAPSDWHKTDIEDVGALADVQDVFAIRIRLSTYTSGEVDMTRVSRVMRLRSDEGMLLDVRADLSALFRENAKDELVIQKPTASTLSVSTWKNNISVQKLVEEILATGHYTGSKILLLEDLKYTLASAALAVLARAPLPNYHKQVTAMCINGTTIFLGVEDELWKFDEIEGLTFLDRLALYKNATHGDYVCHIKRLVIDSAGDLQGIAWKPYDDILYGDDETHSRKTAAIVFRSTNLLTITEQAQVDVSGISVFWSGEVHFREGRVVPFGPNSQAMIGQSFILATGAGESLTLPFPQIMFGLQNNNECGAVKSGLISGGTATSGPGMNRNDAKVLFQLGHYFVGGTVNFGSSLIPVAFSLGQRGVCEWAEGIDKWIFQKFSLSGSPPIPAVILTAIDYTGTVTDKQTITAGRQILCSVIVGDAMYHADMEWDESGSSFPGDLSDCRITKTNSLASPTSYSTLFFDFSTDTVEASQSLSGTHAGQAQIKYCSILEMTYNPAENTLHGCILDRYNFQYHWFVYDITNDKLYSSQSIVSGDFNEGKQLAGFVYNATDEKIYAVAMDVRYGDLPAELLCADFDAGRAAGSEIQITKCSSLIAGESFARTPLAVDAAGRVFGVSGHPPFLTTNEGGKVLQPQSTLWVYGTSFYPQVQVADFGRGNLREALTDCAQVLNKIVQVRANRKIRLASRDTHDGSKMLFEDTHVLSVQPRRIWQHFYDRVEVSWNDPVTGLKGIEAVGAAGYERRVLRIDNPLVQDAHLARVMAQVYFTYFNSIRFEQEAELIMQIELEEMDRVQFILNAQFDVDRTEWWKLMMLEFDLEGIRLNVRGLSGLN